MKKVKIVTGGTWEQCAENINALNLDIQDVKILESSICKMAMVIYNE